jgi:hypothetical protein
MPRPSAGASRQMDRQRRATTPATDDEGGRFQKRGKPPLTGKHRKGYLTLRRRQATGERNRAAQRKRLHGRLVHELVAAGATSSTAKRAARAWQKPVGTSGGRRAPGMFREMLRGTVASTGGPLIAVPPRRTQRAQFCHGGGPVVPQPLWQRWHACPGGISAQRDLSAALLAASLDPADLLPWWARDQGYWAGAEPRLRAADEQAIQRASGGPHLPHSFGIPRVGARLPERPSRATPEPACREKRRETWKQGKEPPGL